MNTWTCSVSRDDKRADRSAASVVQKIALTAIVDQAHNSNERPLLRGPTAKPPFGSRLTLSDRFYTPTLIRPDNERCAAFWGAVNSVGSLFHADALPNYLRLPGLILAAGGLLALARRRRRQLVA